MRTILYYTSWFTACDLYLKLIESTNDITASLHCRDLMKDSATKVTLINPRYNDESDVQLEEDDMVWIEVAESPSETLAFGTGGASFR